MVLICQSGRHTPPLFLTSQNKLTNKRLMVQLKTYSLYREEIMSNIINFRKLGSVRNREFIGFEIYRFCAGLLG